MRLTSVLPGRQAASLLAAMIGDDYWFALRLPPDEIFSDTDLESLLALLRSRFGIVGATSRKVEFNSLRACTRGAATMEEYLVAFDRAIALCEEAGCSLRPVRRS